MNRLRTMKPRPLEPRVLKRYGLLSRRRMVLGVAASITLAACGGGGGGGGDDDDGDDGGDGGGALSGRIITESVNYLTVYGVADRSVTRFPAGDSSFRVGITASASGLVADVRDDIGDSEWRITLRRASDGGIASEYAVAHAYGFPTSAAAINTDGTRLAYSVNELVDDSERFDRTYVVDLASGNASVITSVVDPVFMASGELLVRAGDGLRIFSPELADLGALPVPVFGGEGIASASPDSRYIAYEYDAEIWVYDRADQASWRATQSAVWPKQNPIFSRDGRHLAMLGRGEFALLWVNVIPFVVGATTEVTHANEIKGSDGKSIDGTDRFAWIA